MCYVHVFIFFSWYLQRSEAVGLVVIDEDDSATLLVHRISADDIYRRAQGVAVEVIVMCL
mgnify:CR=1 FL=1